MNRSPWQPATPPTQTELEAATAAVTKIATAGVHGDRMPAVYLGHGAPPLVDDRLWVAQLAAWARALPATRRPHGVRALGVCAGDVRRDARRRAARPRLLRVPRAVLPDDVSGACGAAPGRPRAWIAGARRDGRRAARARSRSRRLRPAAGHVSRADVPVLQLSMPSLDPARLLAVGGVCGRCATKACSSSAAGSSPTACPSRATFAAMRAPPAWSVSSTMGRGDAGALATSTASPTSATSRPRASRTPAPSTSRRCSSPWAQASPACPGRRPSRGTSSVSPNGRSSSPVNRKLRLLPRSLVVPARPRVPEGPGSCRAPLRAGTAYAPALSRVRGSRCRGRR